MADTVEEEAISMVAAAGNRTVRIGEFELDPSAGELVNGESRLTLQEQPLRILQQLVNRPGEVVTRDELQRELWPADTNVDFEHGLNAAIKRLRDALGDSAESPRYIETLPRRGYRLVADVWSGGHGDGADRGPAAVVRRRWWAAGLGLVLIGVAAMWLVTVDMRATRPRPIESVAVLPFSQRGTAQEFFAAGLSDAIAAELGRVTTLRVVSATTAATLARERKTARQLVAELAVDGLIEGTVIREADDVRISIDLVDVRRDVRIWSATYDRKVTGLLVLYAEIARTVADQLRTDVGKPPMPAPRAVPPAAYDAYLQGLYYRRQWQLGGCTKAVRYFDQAIALDPDFGGPYAHLAFCYAYPDRTRQPGAVTAPKARAAAARALALTPDSALAHAINGRISLVYDHDWATPQRECLEARRLRPDPQAMIGCGEMLYLTGREEEGLALMHEALSLDPLNLDEQVAYGVGLLHTRRFDAAIAQFKQTIGRDSNWASARFWLAHAYGDVARRDEAVAEYLAFLRQVIVPERVDRATLALAAAYRESGWNAFWTLEARLAEEDLSRPGEVWRSPHSYYAGPFSMARRYARLADKERALDWLDRAYDYRHHLLPFMDREPLFEVLRGTPRFETLRRKVGLPR